jgi:hypothetical protein
MQMENIPLGQLPERVRPMFGSIISEKLSAQVLCCSNSSQVLSQMPSPRYAAQAPRQIVWRLKRDNILIAGVALSHEH